MRLDKNEREQKAHLLSQWQSPGEMLAAVEAVSNEALLVQSGTQFLRDAWIAATFATATDAEHVRLTGERWPDFETCTRGVVTTFEATEADRPGRTRGSEYRQRSPVVESEELAETLKFASDVPTWVRTAAEGKVARHYSGKTNLVIYLNFSDYGLRTSEVRGSFRSATEPAREAFEQVWVLWQEQAYLIWRHGIALLLDP